jgi:hypothetical protein
VEKRPSHFQRDGRIVLEKAQERKMIINLEKAKGKTLPTSSLSSMNLVDISNVAKVVGISLGSDPSSYDKSVLEILECNNARVVEFEKGCEKCQNEKCSGVDTNVIEGKVMGDVPVTPDNQNTKHQMEDNEE